MSAFLITMAVLGFIAAGHCISSKPNEPRKPQSAADLLISAALNAAIGGWALYLLVNGGAA